MADNSYDVVIVGAGNAALLAALSAREQGASVLVLERAPKAERGGNSVYTDGLMRWAYDGAEDIIALCSDLTPAEIESADFGTYTEDQFFEDLGRITQYRTDPMLSEILITQSKETVMWMRDQGIRFMPEFGRQAFKIDGKYKFWGGATVAVVGGGPGLVEAEFKAVEKAGVEVVYEAWVRELISDDEGVHGVRVTIDGRTRDIAAGSVILACGSFEASAEMRARYLGPGWDLAKVRGSRYNTGDGLNMALAIGAAPKGHWSGCHAVQWERNATDFGDQRLTPQFQRHNYPFAVVVNTEGKRFIDEGADFRNYTYAKYGRAVLAQPGQIAWQIFDSKTTDLLRDEYRTRAVSKISANTLEELAEKLDELDGKQLLKTIADFNAAVRDDAPFNPNVKDGRSADGLDVPRSNWAVKLDTPPYTAYEVTCGVTFAFGGIAITDEGQVVDVNSRPIPGLFAAGEMVGGIFYHNYPGASGLTSGAVFGRLAGRSAAQASLEASSSSVSEGIAR